MKSYVRIGGSSLKNLTYAYMGVGGVKNYQNHAYVINKWSLTIQHIYVEEITDLQNAGSFFYSVIVSTQDAML